MSLVFSLSEKLVREDLAELFGNDASNTKHRAAGAAVVEPLVGSWASRCNMMIQQYPHDIMIPHDIIIQHIHT